MLKTTQPIASKKRKEARSEEYLKFFRDNTPAYMSPILTKTEVESRAMEIIQHPLKSSTGGLTLEQIAADESICFYVGITKMFDIQDEDLRWLTARGRTPPQKKPKNNKKKKYARNRPVLKLRTKGRLRSIKMLEARDEYGFVSETVFSSPFLKDVTRVEDFIQSYFQHLPLGHRLWRCVAKGKSADKDDIHNNCIYKVFITLSETAKMHPNIVVNA
jgi:hypothetical protein